jgi:hypothetical protein
MTTREEQASDAGFHDGFDGNPPYTRFKCLTGHEKKEYDEQYKIGSDEKRNQSAKATRQLTGKR